jgi:hypothetical protein
MVAKGLNRNHIGQVVYVKYLHKKNEESLTAIWITQLVVREDHQHSGVATRMNQRLWTESNPWACGLVLRQPYAVKAHEEATMRKCNKNLSVQHARELIWHIHILFVHAISTACKGTNLAVLSYMCRAISYQSSEMCFSFRKVVFLKP